MLPADSLEVAENSLFSLLEATPEDPVDAAMTTPEEATRFLECVAVQARTDDRVMAALIIVINKALLILPRCYSVREMGQDATETK